MLTTDDVKKTIVTLIRAGKRQQAVQGESMQETAENTIKDWLEMFGDVPLADWQKATMTASMLTEIKGSNLNLNLITPALMKAALDIVERDRLTTQQTTHEEVKDMPMVDSNTPYKNRLLWGWTKRRLAMGVPFEKYMPSDEDIVALAKKIGLTTDELYSNRIYLKVYLNDCNTYKALGQPMPYKAYINKDRVVVFRKPDGTPEEFQA